MYMMVLCGDEGCVRYEGVFIAVVPENFEEALVVDGVG